MTSLVWCIYTNFCYIVSADSAWMVYAKMNEQYILDFNSDSWSVHIHICLIIIQLANHEHSFVVFLWSNEINKTSGYVSICPNNSRNATFLCRIPPQGSSRRLTVAPTVGFAITPTVCCPSGASRWRTRSFQTSMKIASAARNSRRCGEKWMLLSTL